MLKTINCEEISRAVAELAFKSNIFLPEDIKKGLDIALKREKNPLACDILGDLILNQKIAAENSLPLCQDTGAAVFFVELGQDIQIKGGLLYDAINQGIARGYTDNYLRKSMVSHPWLRQNTGDNTPAIIHICLKEGDKLKITLMPKGGGAENCSALAMLTPAQDLKGIKDFILKTVKKAGANACPPLIIGIGIGGNFETAPLLAKKALTRNLYQPHPQKEVAALEEELLEEINKMGIGPQGLGGDTTALGVFIEIFPCHIASLPVAVNLNCHVSRHLSVTL